MHPVIESVISENPHQVKEALLNLKVIDPACGSGHFLIAAARRIAEAIAQHEGESDVPEETLRHQALGLVVQRCIYGVDVNPMAVELCKATFWIEVVRPGKPLPFLDAHIQCGNSLLGVLDLAQLEEGIPDEAYAACPDDDKKICASLRKTNRQQKSGEFAGDLFDREGLQGSPCTGVKKVFDGWDDTLEDVENKELAWLAFQQDESYLEEKLRADLFYAPFLAEKTTENLALIPTNDDLHRIKRRIAPRKGVGEFASMLAKAYGLFHWHLRFPEVSGNGFDIVLSNPPWEVSRLNEQEYFVRLDPGIAALKGSKRKQAIKELEKEKPFLWQRYAESKQRYEHTNHALKVSGRFKLTTKGQMNLYRVFAELCSQLRGLDGRAGMIVPSGIASDYGNKDFFEYLVTENLLISFYDFENRLKLFPIDSRCKFGLLTIGRVEASAKFAFFLTHPLQLTDDRRRSSWTAQELSLVNPNTHTAPVSRTWYDAELLKKIYRRVPPLMDETKGAAGNPWGIRFAQGIFNMTTDSHFFRTAVELEEKGGALCGNSFVMADKALWMPLYEAKMIHHYDHRWATYSKKGDDCQEVSSEMKCDPSFVVLPQYWVPAEEMETRLQKFGWSHSWLLSWRDISNSTNERTIISSVLPRVATGHKLPLVMPSRDVGLERMVVLNAFTSSLVLDYVARQKIAATNVSFFIYKQLPLFSPHSITEDIVAFILPRVIELIYTSQEFAGFAADLGYPGQPFIKNETRERQLRAELDAFVAKLYGLSREEFQYILDPRDILGDDFPSETFRVLRESEERHYGEFLTKRLCLAAWDNIEQVGKRYTA